MRLPFDRLRPSTASLAVALALGVGLWAAPAEAHVAMTSPMARYPQDHQKSEPCGHPENPPGDGPVATYQAGETITIEFDEFVNHGGHFRVALDATGTDDFTSPTGFEDFYNSPQVLLDDVSDEQNGGLHSIEVTLPNEPCDPCTLQLIQVMNDGTWGPGLSDLYFQCADIVIEGAAGETGGEMTSGGDETSGNDSSSGGGGGTSTGPDNDDPTDDDEHGHDSSGGGESTGGVNPGPETTGPADSEDDDAGGCGCRADQGSRGAAVLLLLVPLLAWRRRRFAAR